MSLTREGSVMNKKTVIGVFYSTLYVILVPIANFFREIFLKKENSITFLFYAFVFSFLFFNIINIKKINLIYKKSLSTKFLFLKINILILLIWTSSFLAPVYFGAVYSVLTIFSVIGLLGTVSKKIKKECKTKLIQRTFSITLYLSGLVIIITHAFVLNTFYGLFFALNSGLFTFLYIKNSQKFSQEANLTASEVLAVRYWGVFAFIPIFFTKKIDLLSIILSPYLLSMSIFVSFVSMILPVYLNQKSLYYIEYKLSSTILSFIPCAAWLMYMLQGKKDYSSTLITTTCLLIFFAGILSVLSNGYKFNFNLNKKS